MKRVLILGIGHHLSPGLADTSLDDETHVCQEVRGEERKWGGGGQTK